MNLFRCRKGDQNPASRSSSSRAHHGQSSHNYPFYSAGNPEPRDIIPRASPSRPNSMHFSSPPTTPGYSSQQHYAQQERSAISALRSLSIARPPSPPSPTSSTAHPSLWPFTRSAATSPSTSYTRGSSGFFSSTYDGGYGGGYASGYASGYGGGGAAASAGYAYASSGADRPLPARRPGGYSRPKSIELVTPMVGR